MTWPRSVNAVLHQHHQELTPEIPLYLHVVVGADRAALVDGGLPQSASYVDELLAAAGVSDDGLGYLLNTHAHHDHIGTFAALRERTRALVVAAPGAASWIEDTERNLREFALHRCDIIPDSPQLRAELEPTYERDCTVDLTVVEGTAVQLGGGVALEALSVPGHVRAELAWFERSTRTLVLGDAVTGTSWPFFHGHVDPTLLRRTLDRLRAFAYERDVELVCFSHYEPRDKDAFDALLDAVRDYLDQVWAAVRQALDDEPHTLAQIWQATCQAMGKEPEFRSLAMVSGHVSELVANGEARQVGPDEYVKVRPRRTVDV